MSTAPREVEQFWHQCALVTILVIAAFTRFYCIDQWSFSSNELRNLVFCDIDGWFTMMADYRAHSGMPALYPTLLCKVTDLTSHTEFFVRLLSAIAGLASIYILYITGRDFLSPATGLLAAATMAASYQVILFNREASYVSLLLLVFFAHSYCFCRLFFYHDDISADHNSRPFILNLAGKRSQLQWTWHPNLPCDGQFLVGFWITGVLVFYTSNTSLILLGSEFLASILLVAKCISPEWSRAKLLRRLWIPMLIGALPWIYVLYGFKGWVLGGDFFVLPGLAALWQKLQPFFPSDFFKLAWLAALLVFFVVYMIAAKALKKNHWLPGPYLTYGLYQLLVAVLSLWFIAANNYSSHLYFWWVFVLMLMTPIGFIINQIRHDTLRYSVLGATLFIIVIVQVSANARHKIYDTGRFADFRLAAKIIHDDQDFMASTRTLFVSSDLFNHYLDGYGITANEVAVLDNTKPLENVNAFFNNSEFYYLEHRPQNRNLQNNNAAFQSLTAQYKTLCMTTMPGIHITKFSRDASATVNENQDCRRYLSDRVSLK